ncbi:MAG TPA: transcription antitermination factor NusB [Candidatus Acidoferrales bacterium]|nr:transcription antitermination factor NusB [Candidatus Acidoferrales bacterium]
MRSRELALNVVRDVFRHDRRPRGAHESFDYHATRSGLDARDRAFAAELAYGSIKARRYLDWLLAPFIGGRTAPLPPTILEVLRLGVYQLACMAVPTHATVSETVGLAKRHGHRGTAGLVNAVLRRVSELEPERRTPRREDFKSEDDFYGTVHSFPTWIVSSVRGAFGDAQIEPILRGMNEPPQTALRVNLLRTTTGEALDALSARAIAAHPSNLVPEIVLVDGAVQETLADADGRWEQQAEIAAVPVDVLDPRPDMQGVELCSGRGNKTFEIVGRTRDRGTLEAVERDAHKAAHLRTRLREAGIQSVRVREGDATQPGGAAQDADFVLVDAPCSGLGILGRQPEARWRKEPGDPDRLASLQGELLERGSQRVRVEGRLVYSVCTFAPVETNEQIEAFLRRHPDFSRAVTAPGYAAWRLPSGDLRFPPGLERRDGFYIALLERRKPA